jgi:hypothetical protein
MNKVEGPLYPTEMACLAYCQSVTLLCVLTLTVPPILSFVCFFACFSYFSEALPKASFLQSSQSLSAEYLEL